MIRSVMNKSELDIDYKILSYSFVLIWSNNVPFIPTLSQDFSVNIFNSPENTSYIFSNSGILISTNPIYNNPSIGAVNPIVIEPGVYPQINFTPQFYMNFNNDLDSLTVTNDDLIEQFDKLNPNFLKHINVSQLGINLEVEVNFSDGLDKNKWSQTELFGSNIDSFKEFVFKEYKYTLEEDFSKQLNIEIQPRVNNKNSLYMKVNDHYGISPFNSILKTNGIKNFIQVSVKKLEDLVLPTFSNHK